MSLYEMHYVSNASEQARLKEQQQVILKAFKELSIPSNLNQQKEHEQLLYRDSLSSSSRFDHSQQDKSTKFDMWLHSSNYLLISNECRPYSPYTEDCLFETSSYTSSISHSSGSSSTRQRTPSMVSVSSSYASEATSSSFSLNEGACSNISTETALSERDALGFKRPTQWVKPAKLYEFEQKYKAIQEKQTKSWNKLYMNYNQKWPSLCPQLSRYARKGIPQHMRAKVWLHYSGAEKKMTENTGLYQRLLQDAEKSNNEHASAIQKDLHRTFPDNTFFACDVESKDGSILMDVESNPKLQKLRRVLLAFSVHSPEIGYCQSLNFLAGFLLLFQDEEEAFWILVAIVHDYFPENMFDTTMQGGNLEQTVLMSMIYEKMPGVWAKIADKKCFWECEQQDSLPPVTLVTSHWFLTLFINVLPVETVLRIWDCFFVGEGFKMLYQAALTILKLNEQRIWDVKDSIDTLQILQSTPKRMIDCDQFIKCVFSSKNDIAMALTIEEIVSKRDLFRSRKSQRNGQQ